MDDSRNFDLDRMMEQIRLKVRDSRRSAQSGSPAANGTPGNDPQMERDLAELHQAYDLSRVPLTPNRRVLGWTILTAARAVSALLSPIIRRQSEYNAANTRLTTELTKNMDGLRPQIADIGASTERMIAHIREDFRAQNQALTRRFATTYAADIAMHAQVLGELSRRIGALEASRQRWEEQSQRLAALERRHEELRQELDRYGLASYPQRLQEQDQRLRDQEREFAERDRRIESLGAQLSELSAAIAAARAAQSEAHEQFKRVREQVSRAERRLRRLLNADIPAASAPVQENPPAALPDGAAAEMDYAGFEDRMRGSQEVKDKQRRYVEYFAGKAPVIDVGCGKGEFLELMREAGIAAKGLDVDLDMILLCKEKGLDVERRDAIEYLADQPDGSLGGIFSAQVIEHLTTAQLNALIALAWRKLMPGGVVVLETLNPESLFVHYKWFWMDPSHVRLVHPQTLQFQLESAGFTEITCRYSPPPPDVVRIPPLQGSGLAPLDDFNRATDYLNGLLYSSWEYATIARK
jgi:2-polyprenyl-3-methyl-5-hydroxy-6-metoxy-1,4-benzoquinol methylase